MLQGASLPELCKPRAAGEGKREMESTTYEKGDDDYEIVIVGGGICGLATALALHRKGLNSVVLEREDSLRATGAAIALYTNGWRALDQLRLGTKLQQKTIPIEWGREVSLDNGTAQEFPTGKEEVRCLRRSDLIETLAEGLPAGTIRCSCHVVGVEMDKLNSFPILRLHDGSAINCKVVISCDGVNSVIAESLKLKPPRISQIESVRGLTNYQDEHSFGNAAIRMMKNQLILGIVPIDKKCVHWFLSGPGTLRARDYGVSRDPLLIREATMYDVKEFPAATVEMIKNSDPASLSYTPIKYRAPWDLLLGQFRKGSMVAAGDAMHVMGPFVGQGGAAALEDAVVLGRCLAEVMCTNSSLHGNGWSKQLQTQVGMALDKYAKERKMRVLRLSIQTYLRGLTLETLPSPVKLVVLTILSVFFGNSLGHAQYDCGKL